MIALGFNLFGKYTAYVRPTHRPAPTATRYMHKKTMRPAHRLSANYIISQVNVVKCCKFRIATRFVAVHLQAVLLLCDNILRQFQIRCIQIPCVHMRSSWMRFRHACQESGRLLQQSFSNTKYKALSAFRSDGIRLMTSFGWMTYQLSSRSAGSSSTHIRQLTSKTVQECLSCAKR